MIIVSKIKNIRLGLGLTVEFLSTEIGVSPSYLTLIENGKRRLPKRLVGKLAKAFKLPKKTVYNWYLEQELEKAGILKMTPEEKENLLKRLLFPKNS